MALNFDTIVPAVMEIVNDLYANWKSCCGKILCCIHIKIWKFGEKLKVKLSQEFVKIWRSPKVIHLRAETRSFTGHSEINNPISYVLSLIFYPFPTVSHAELHKKCQKRSFPTKSYYLPISDGTKRFQAFSLCWDYRTLQILKFLRINTDISTDFFLSMLRIFLFRFFFLLIIGRFFCSTFPPRMPDTQGPDKKLKVFEISGDHWEAWNLYKSLPFAFKFFNLYLSILICRNKKSAVSWDYVIRTGL